jgi:hypothetical protein
MTLAALVSILAALCILGVTAWYYSHRSIPKRTVLILLVVRAAALIALLLAFFQPSISLKTLLSGQKDLAILVDGSQSMQLCNSDSSLSRSVDICRNFVVAGNNSKTCDMFVFGDSLRMQKNHAPYDFSDTRSFFPSAQNRALLSRYRTILILSDGNWSNPSLPYSLSETANPCFVVLPSFSPRPFIRADWNNAPAQVMQDSLQPAMLHIEGYAPQRRIIDVSASEQASVIQRKTLSVDSGYFSDTLSLTFPAAQAGRHLYTISVRNSADTVSSGIYLTQQVIPGTCNALLYSPVPVLDTRFITVALSQITGCAIHTTNVMQNADILFVLNWNTSVEQQLSQLKPSTVIVFMGCAPAGAHESVVPDSFAILPGSAGDTLARTLAFSQLPPPSRILVEPAGMFTVEHTLLWCTAHTKNDTRHTNDTLPFLSTGFYKKHSAVFVAASDVWKLEFLPLGVGHSTETSSVLRTVIQLAQNTLFANLNRSLYVYPAVHGIREGDSCEFSCMLPAGIDYNTAPKLHVVVESDKNQTIVDTAFVPYDAEAYGTHVLRLRPLPVGHYRYSASLSGGAGFSGTFTVESYNPEYAILGQNIPLLKELALPVAADSIQQFLQKAVSHGLDKNTTIVRTFQIAQTWWLWGIIILLFAVEWAIRKNCKIDD